MKEIELLAPAKNLECGIAAIDNGADAVYIGAQHFGARASAVNSCEEIKQLCDYAHVFGAKIYVTLNTIVYEQELDEARQQIRELRNTGVDAFIVQDMAMAEMIKQECPEIEIHASTQMDNRNPSKAAWLYDNGFSRVVLARELTCNEIRQIHEDVPEVELEVFVHGALCVSYSGACYASQHCFGRSANRGECAQFCRLAFNLSDSEGKTIKRDSHLLSLKDMCQIGSLDKIIEAGATSLKIEGRLKDVHYVENVTAAYSKKLNEIISRNPQKYKRASYGSVKYLFTPDLNKTFNRGYTDYFLNGRHSGIVSFETPKALGENVGHVKEIRPGFFTVAGIASFANGDGLCFINEDNKLEGFRVNKVAGNKIFPLRMPSNLKQGMCLYRNNDHEFEKILSQKTAERKISVSMSIGYSNNEITLKATDECRRSATSTAQIALDKANKPQEENIVKQLGKLGNTPFAAGNIVIEKSITDLFVPSSILAGLRRTLANKLLQAKTNKERNIAQKHTKNINAPLLPTNINAENLNIANVSNHIAKEIYERCGVNNAKEAYELAGTGARQTPIMTCKYCIRHALGHCMKKENNNGDSWKSPLYLSLPNGKRFRLDFDCKKCQMKIYADN